MIVPALISVGLSAVVAAVMYVVSVHRARAIEASASENRVHDFRVAGRRMSAVAAFGGGVSSGVYLALTARDLGRPWAAFGALGMIIVCSLVPLAAGRRPIAAGYSRVRGITTKAPRSPRRYALLALALVLRFWPAVLVAAVPVGLGIRLLILLAGYPLLSPVAFGLAAPAVAALAAPAALPAEVEARLTRLGELTGVRMRGRTMPTAGRKLANALQLGWLPGLRYMLISDYLLGQVTRLELDAVLCHEIAHARHGDTLVRQVLSAAQMMPIGMLLAVLTLRSPSPGAIGGMLVFCLVLLLGRRLVGVLMIRQELAADDFAVRLTSPGQLVGALERLTELNEIKADTTASWDRTVGHPGIARRIVRLQAMAERAPAS